MSSVVQTLFSHFIKYFYQLPHKGKRLKLYRIMITHPKEQNLVSTSELQGLIQSISYTLLVELLPFPGEENLDSVKTKPFSS